MKKTILLLVMLALTTLANAQSLLLGDTDQNGKLTIADVTKSVNMILGKEAQQTLTLDHYRVDNSVVAGTWYMPDATQFVLNADGTTTYPGGSTFEFIPSQGHLIIYDATGRPIKAIGLWKITQDYMLVMDYDNLGSLIRYTSTEPIIMVTSITLNKTSLELELNDYERLTATVLPTNAANRSVTWTSSDENVATVISGFVEAVGEGTCTITCTAQDGSGVKATCAVTVGPIDTHEYVDLGLPSGTLWATCNIGADNPEDYGDYFAWGETTGYKNGKTNFDWSTYKWCNGSESTLTKYCNDSSYGNNGFTDTLTELEPEDDAAYVNWGANWRMPSKEQFEELTNSSYTTTTWTTQNGVYGRKITSKSNGKSLFLPAAGSRNDTSLGNAGGYGYYWSRTLSARDPSGAYDLDVSSNYILPFSSDRYVGFTVRPVRVSQ